MSVCNQWFLTVVTTCLQYIVSIRNQWLYFSSSVDCRGFCYTEMEYNRIYIRHVCHISQKYTETDWDIEKYVYPKYVYIALKICNIYHLKKKIIRIIKMSFCCFSTALMKLLSITYIWIYIVPNNWFSINNSAEMF